MLLSASQRAAPLRCWTDGINIFAVAGDAFQGLSNDVFFADVNAKQRAGNAGDGVFITIAGHGGRGADAHEFFGAKALAQAAHKQRHVCALAPPVPEPVPVVTT